MNDFPPGDNEMGPAPLAGHFQFLTDPYRLLSIPKPALQYLFMQDVKKHIVAETKPCQVSEISDF